MYNIIWLQNRREFIANVKYENEYFNLIQWYCSKNLLAVK